MLQNRQIWPKSKAIGLLFLPQIVHFQLFSTFFNFLHFPAQINKCLKTAKCCQKVRLSASYFCQKLSIPICTNSSTNQRVPQNSQIWPKSKAIGLLFFPKIVHFQLSSFSSTNQKAPQNSQIWPKSKAIGLLFFPKIVHFQLSSTFFNSLHFPVQIQECFKTAKFGQKVRL